MKVLVLLAIAVIGTQAVPTKDLQWESFKVSFNRRYTNEKEELFRRDLFLARLEHFENHNAKYEQGLVSYKLNVNKFADFTEAELEAYRGLKKPEVLPQATSSYAKPAGFQAPDTWDWRETAGVVGPIKDQASCGSCWAFSTVGALEGAYAIANGGATVVLSEQNLVDCVTDNWGCDGGWMSTAYDYILANQGIDTESSYPYEAVDGTCRYSAGNIGAAITGYTNITYGDEDELKNACASAGPVAVAIDASGDFSFYGGGVYYNEYCDPSYLDHAVVVIGYGVEDGQDYWLVRNSWGASWGLEGYIKMSRNRDNNCGITSAASYPQV